MAIALTLRGFNGLGHSATTIFYGSFSLPICYVLQKNETNLSSRILNILQNAPLNSVLFTSSYSCASVLNASLRVKVCVNDGNI